MEAQTLSSLLKQRIQFYKEENAKMESAFLKLNLLNEDLELNRNLEEIVNKLSKYQEQFNTKELTVNAIVLAYADKLQKRNNYIEKLKMNLKTYTNLNAELSKKIEKEKCVLERENTKLENLLNLTPEELKAMEEKIKNYENELIKFEKKYPWLKEEKYDLLNIAKELDILTDLKAEQDKLANEVSVYRGLKPDLKEAMEQLAQVKIEYEQITNKLLTKSN